MSTTHSEPDPSAEAAALLAAITELASATEAVDYSKLGYHHRHVADQGEIPAIARRFFDAGYLLEMITCQDRREDLDAMRLVYTFNHLGVADRHLIHADVAARTVTADDGDGDSEVSGDDAGDDSGDGASGPGESRDVASARVPVDPRDAICYGIDAEAVSITPVYLAADWFEREVYDMYGVRFLGHPNMQRILLPEDAEFHALLKDFGRMEDAEGES